MLVNARLERRIPGKKKRFETKTLTGLIFDGSWEDTKAHTNFRRRVHTENPGWRLMMYELTEHELRVDEGF